MIQLIQDFIAEHANTSPDAIALQFKDQQVSYRQLQVEIAHFAEALLTLGVGPGERVAVYLPKQLETVYALFGTAQAGACFVPVNPVLKPRQLAHLLPHCNVRVLVTNRQRLSSLTPVLKQCSDLHTVVLVDGDSKVESSAQVSGWETFIGSRDSREPHPRIDSDMAAILYTSGSTGHPKGVVLSHRNLIAGADSVATYLHNNSEDRVLAVLPLSFDAGLSQLTTAFSVGATAVLMDYLLPRDVIRAVARYGITGLAAVPPLWNQLRDLPWPAEAAESLRYITNTGGAMPVSTTRALQAALPSTQIYLMYGLTEAFRSTYLPPEDVNARPDSIGKAIPNADIMVINDTGEPCRANEPGELVHRGALVSLGYWNDPVKTAERFKPCPVTPREIPTLELAVWSGDQVVRDEQGYLYFVGRKDEMIKTSGYRVSPTEVEEVADTTGLVSAAAAIGVPHAELGQAIALIVSANVEDQEKLINDILVACRRDLPNYMIPLQVIVKAALPLNQNGKIDRRNLAEEYHQLFQDPSA
ncbi:MAG: acyl-CoA ligase (AMP-forming), exosortase A system-associated [Pseudomonadota bacterium]